MLARRLCFLGLVIGLALVLFGRPAPLQAQSPITVQAYHDAVAQALALTKQAQVVEGSERASLLNSAADQLEAIQQVQTPSGALVNVNNSELIALVRDPDQTDVAVARLAALESVLAQPLATVAPADLAALQELLSRPPFAQPTELPWWQTILLQILAFLERLAGNTAQGVFEWRDLLIVLAVVVVIGVLVYFILNLRRNLVSEESIPPALLQQEARTPGEAFDNAQRHINAGDYRSAVRQLYLATLLLLDQHGRIKYDPTLTNREYLRQTRNDARTTAALQPIVETFDRTWYGFEPISKQDFEEYRQRVEGIKSL